MIYIANGKVESLKVIDLGSAFEFKQINMAVEITTPEYMPPEILDFDITSKSSTSAASNIQKKMWPWSVDVWSCGIIILELILGFPVWMAYKSRIVKAC